MRILTFPAIGLLATPALAQDTMVEVQDRAALPGFEINADVADDLDVLAAAGVKIGEVEEVVGPDRDTPEALVVDFEDEAATYGAEDRVVPLTAFLFDGSAMQLNEGTDVTGLPIWND
ncbi:hypothetical protein ACOI1H_14460 [Loktanella sp. DJP18]|uniref:hypothetical protein n=1 Tax=Loktanella sp. DJP18 TaxID=3409788 RepID=UPI003BB772CC